MDNGQAFSEPKLLQNDIADISSNLSLGHKYRLFVVLAGIVCFCGCASVARQHQQYITDRNREIGSPFCENPGSFDIVVISPSEKEFIPRLQPGEGGVAWRVDTSKAARYHLPNCALIQSQGIKKSWRFVGDPMKCLVQTDWLAPW